MKVLETDYWSLLLPPEWFAERDDGAVLISDRDGVGCIEISELHRDDTATLAETIGDFAGEVPGGLSHCSIGELAGYSARFEEEGAAIREWYLGTGRLLLYITYSCDLDNAGMDDAVVDDILSTLRVVVE